MPRKYKKYKLLWIVGNIFTEVNMIGDLITGMLTAEEGATLGLGMMMIVLLFSMLIGIGIYIYSAFALMEIAKKTGTEPAWLAWIPVANLVLISKIAKMHWWPILMMIPSFIFYIAGFVSIILSQKIIGIVLLSIAGVTFIIFGVYSTLWNWKMFEAVKRPGWWSIVPIAPALIYLASSLSESIVFQFVGVVLYIGGMIAYMILFGVSAWSEPRGSKPATITKISDIKNTGVKKNNKR